MTGTPVTGPTEGIINFPNKCGQVEHSSIATRAPNDHPTKVILCLMSFSPISNTSVMNCFTSKAN